MSVIADSLSSLSSAGNQLPQPGTEVGTAQDHVQRQADQGEDQWQLVEVH